MVPNARRLAAIVTILVLGVAACGGDDDDGDVSSASGSGSSAEESTTAPDGDPSEAPVTLDGSVNDHGTEEIGGGSAEVELELDDFYFGPTYLRAEPGATVTFVLENEGDAPHTFTIDTLDVDTEVAPGEATEVEVTLPDRDATLFYCRFHQDQGMQGAVYFEEGDQVAARGEAGGGDEPAAGPYGG